MSTRITTFFELLLVLVVLVSIGLGVNWTSVPAQANQREIETPPAVVAQNPVPQQEVVKTAESSPTPGATQEITATAIVSASGTVLVTGTVKALPTPSTFNPKIQVEVGDAPLLVQAPGTMNILLLGSDNSVDERYSRTDTILIASINTELPSVSLLSIPRDMQVRIPNHTDDRVNTAFEYGYLSNYPGGGPAFLAVVLRKNFGIKIDHYVRIDFKGFVNAVDTLGGVDVLAECELHDTFPDKSSPNGKIDLDVFPGKVSLQGKQALMFARSRWSTSDFDRARRQQKVLRALFTKVKGSNLLQNALGLYQDVRQNVDTDLGLETVPTFVEIASRLENLAIKNRVVTYPVLKAFTRRDGAMVLLPTTDTISYIAEALSPPAGNRAQNRMQVEVVNASGRPDMEAVAAERLTWEGFLVSSSTVTDTRQAKTEIIDFTSTPKGSPIPRLASVFNVAKSYISAEPDPGSSVAARVVLGANYNSCPATSSIAGDVTLTPSTKLIPTSTPAR